MSMNHDQTMLPEGGESLTRKKPYRKPYVQIYGNLAQITENAPNTTNPDHTPGTPPNSNNNT